MKAKMRLAVFAAAVMTMGTTLRAEVKTEAVEYKHGETVLQGFVVYDDAVKEKRPGVVVCSAKSSDADRQRARDLSADEYVTKPFEPDDLVTVIRDVLSRKSARV